MKYTEGKKLNILLCTHIFFPKNRAGTEVLTYELAQGLKSLGHDISILTGEPEDNIYYKVKPWITSGDYEGLLVYRLHYGTKRNAFLNHIDIPERIELTQNLINTIKPDLVHFNHLIGFSTKIISIIRSMRIPVVFIPTDFWAICPKITLLRTFDQSLCDGPKDIVNCLRCFKHMPKYSAQLLIKASQSPIRNILPKLNVVDSLIKRQDIIINNINSADKILPATHFLKEKLISQSIKQNKIKVVSYGVDIGLIPSKISIPNRFTDKSPLHLGFIGSLVELKGPHIIVDALKCLGNDKKRVVLDIYGQFDDNNSYHQRLKTKIEDIGPSVQLKGVFPHHKMGEVLRSFHFLIVPSIWHEDTPLVLCSALSAGIPAIVSKVGGMTEVINEGINGFSFPVGDSRSLSAIILEILNNPRRLASIFENDSFWNRSTLDYTIDIENEYKKLLSFE